MPVRALFQNTGSTDLFYAVGGDTVTAAIPEDGAPANGVFLAGGATRLVDMGGSTHVSAITADGTADLYITPGDGDYDGTGAGGAGGGGVEGPIEAQRPQQTVAPVTIANGQSLSPAVDLGLYRLAAIHTPASFEGTSITFQGSYDGTTWHNVYDADNNEYVVSAGATRRIALPIGDFIGLRHLKVRSGTSGVPSAVGADRILQLVAEG